MNSASKSRTAFFSFLIFVLFFTHLHLAGHAEKSPFMIDDSIRVKSFSPQNITKDGRYIAGVISIRKDRLGTDHKRYRDPTYISPRPVEVVINIIANQGWFGLRPSANLEIGYPGESWVKGVTSVINKLIERGLVDPKKLGVHGTSYGGYATSLLITQTDRFAAAVNISGKVNIISFLGDSPRIGHRNYGAAEAGQDRIGQTLWEAPLKYINHSAVMFADRIKTPHLLITGEGDWNVPAGNTRELYYALRRLGKECVWVNYWNDGHGLGAVADEATYLDKWNRILDWYKTYFAKADEKDKIND